MSGKNKKELAATFSPAEIEAPLYKKWLSAGYFKADAKSKKPAFTIVIPPPNVTGSLHIGHALDHTIQDLLIRMKRMKGFEALWLPGMDHAGIATQNVVEKQLATQGKSRHDLGREAFIEKVWQWKAESGGAILDQMKRLGDSVDWDREAFTMDENLSKAVLTIFKRLYEKELIYRAERIINWCPRCLTALSDIEVEHKDDAGEFVSIKYGDDDVSITVATTRAETMLGDGAVAVNPSDERYKHLIGKKVLLPLVDRMIPIIADELVDPEFGTGAVKVTAAHDPNDFEMGMRHGVELVVIMNEHGVMAGTGTKFDGLDRFDARKAVVEELRKLGRVVAEKRPYVHAVGHCQRCDTTVEPRLSKQWFVKVAPLAKAAADAVRDGRVKIEPEQMSPRYFEWVDNMHDWCISRQLWWGHRIPVFYGPNDEVVVCGPDEKPPAGYTQDPDVLDTWFSSALWPTGYDILFFWVARMMIMGLFAMDGKQPFNVIALHGLVRDQFGKKMSKSRGNTVDPIEFMDKYGSDALRFTLARGANPGTDQALAEDWIAGSRNFATKLWNATRFAMLNGANIDGDLPKRSELNAIDNWILTRLDQTISSADELFEKFEFAKACELIYHFAWDDLCDWYLELSKSTFAKADDSAKQSARVLGEVLDQLLRLMHPVMPFITEELWCYLTNGESLMITQWPKSVRNDQGIKSTAKVVAKFSGLKEAGLESYEAALRHIVKCEAGGTNFTAKTQIGNVIVDFDLTGAIDLVAERARLTKDLQIAQKDRDTAKVKLDNEGFMAKAPMEVVTEIRARLSQTTEDIARITALLEKLPK